VDSAALDRDRRRGDDDAVRRSRRPPAPPIERVLAATCGLCVAASGLLFDGTVTAKILIFVAAIAAFALLIVSLNRTDRGRRAGDDHGALSGRSAFLVALVWGAGCTVVLVGLVSGRPESTVLFVAGALIAVTAIARSWRFRSQERMATDASTIPGHAAPSEQPQK
jgi:hypothetical protein